VIRREADVVHVTPPLTDAEILQLRAGDAVRITGTLLTGRDAAHKRLVELLKNGQPLPVDLKGQIIYYVGPTPPKPGQVIGSAGPTTGGRMDSTTEPLLKAGLKGAIGKGERGAATREAFKKHVAVYFGAIGGSGAFLAKRITVQEVIAYPELGTEAIRRLTVEDFPVVVINDAHGADFYEEGRRKYATP
jgi:fumarate hydratase subunit beta